MDLRYQSRMVRHGFDSSRNKRAESKWSHCFGRSKHSRIWILEQMLENLSSGIDDRRHPSILKKNWNLYAWEWKSWDVSFKNWSEEGENICVTLFFPNFSVASTVYNMAVFGTNFLFKYGIDFELFSSVFRYFFRESWWNMKKANKIYQTTRLCLTPYALLKTVLYTICQSKFPLRRIEKVLRKKTKVQFCISISMWNANEMTQTCWQSSEVINFYNGTTGERVGIR